MLITDQVATAPCTDPIQERFRTLEAKLKRIILVWQSSIVRNEPRFLQFTGSGGHGVALVL